MENINPFCLSSYLTFRYVVRAGETWTQGVTPALPQNSGQAQIGVHETSQIIATIRRLIDEQNIDDSFGILLSGGIDSAILAALLPQGTKAYTIRFVAENAIDESIMAEVYARRAGLKHKTVEVTWTDYLEFMDLLMLNKKAPLHAVEVGLYKAARTAFAEGVRTLVIGNGADSTFGGMDKLLSKDWTFDQFVHRYTFVDPASVVTEPVSMLPTYEKYRVGAGVDVVQFLKITHGVGIIQAFDNAIGAAGCKTFEPFERLFLDAPLDLNRIRSGDSKYLLRPLFEQLYPGLNAPEKVPFARPMDEWMKTWIGPQRPEFRQDLDLNSFTGEQKWLIYCLERFLNLIEDKRGGEQLPVASSYN